MFLALLFCIINILDFSTGSGHKTKEPQESEQRSEEKLSYSKRKEKEKSLSNNSSSILCLPERDLNKEDHYYLDKSVKSIQMDVNYYSMDSLDYYNPFSYDNENVMLNDQKKYSEKENGLTTWIKLKNQTTNSYQYKSIKSYCDNKNSKEMNSQGESLRSIDSIILDNNSSLEMDSDSFVDNKNTQTSVQCETQVADGRKPIWIFYPNYTLPNLDFLYNKKTLKKNRHKSSSSSASSSSSLLTPPTSPSCVAVNVGGFKQHFNYIQDWDSLNVLLPKEYKNLHLHQMKNPFFLRNGIHFDDEDDEGVDAGNSSTNSSSSLDLECKSLEKVVYNDELRQFNDYLRQVNVTPLTEEKKNVDNEDNLFDVKSYVKKFMSLKINARNQVATKIEKKNVVGDQRIRKFQHEQMEDVNIVDSLEITSIQKKYDRKSTTPSRIPVLISRFKKLNSDLKPKILKSRIPIPVQSLPKSTSCRARSRYVKTLNCYQPENENRTKSYKRNERFQMVTAINDRWLSCRNGMRPNSLVHKNKIKL